MGGDGIVWGLADDDVNGGSSVNRYEGDDLQHPVFVDGGAVRIAAVNEVSSCVVNSLGEIFLSALK